jgi:hypothetical protein
MGVQAELEKILEKTRHDQVGKVPLERASRAGIISLTGLRR